MDSTWNYRDLFDLEFYLHLDRGTGLPDQHRRDRQFVRQGAVPAAIPDDRLLLKYWLRARKEQHLAHSGQQQTPGDMLFALLRPLRLGLLLFGLVAGGSAGLTFFSYSGNAPVNVFHFIFLFIFSQLGLLLILLFAALLRLAGVRSLPSATTAFYSSIISAVTSRSTGRLFRRLPAQSRAAAEQALGSFRKIAASHGSLLYWPLFTLAQAVLVCCNGGLLATSLFRILTSDMAFGWQSTVQFSAPFIHRLVTLLALPWSWLVPAPYAHPSLAEIEGSRFILKDGIYHLATQDLISWWPFLLLSLLCYGLLMRLLLVFLGRYCQKRELNRLRLDRPELARIIHHLRTPVVSTQAPAQDDSPQPNDRSGNAGAAALAAPAGKLLITLISDDIARQHQPAAIENLLAGHGIASHSCHPIMADYDADQMLLQQLSQDKAGESGYLLLFEAWMVPINDTLAFIKQLRAAAGANAPVYVGLVGREQHGTPFTRPAEADCRIWRRKIEALGDPYTTVLALSPAGQGGEVAP